MIAPPCLHIKGLVPLPAATTHAVPHSWSKLFGEEESLQEYGRNTADVPVFAVQDSHQVVSFASLHQRFTESGEIDCVAVMPEFHRQRLASACPVICKAGRQSGAGGKMLQVKALADTYPSLAYAQSRAFYRHCGFLPLTSLSDPLGHALPQPVNGQIQREGMPETRTLPENSDNQP